MEKLDIFDETYNPLGFSTVFDEAHGKGLWHQTFACWVVNKNNGTVMLQLRGPKNLVDPGSFDASAGGHLASGEKPEDGFRELEEELGITIPETNRVYLGIFRNIAVRGNYINREFCHVFLAESSHTLHDLKLEKGEVDGAVEILVDDAIKLFSKKLDVIKAKSVDDERNLKISDMCNYHERANVSNYYLKVMLAARDFIKGEEILVI